MEVQLGENQEEFVRKIAKEQGFVDFEIKTSSGSSKGDNYLGVLTTVSVENHKKKLDLILKAALTSKELRDKIPVRKFFLREMFLYDTILPAITKFQKEEGLVDGFSGHAKLYSGCYEEFSEFLILENLKAAHYELWSRRVPMNDEHVTLVLREYGKLHAASLAMKEKRPELFAKLTENLSNVFEGTGSPEENSEMTKRALGNGYKAVKGNKLATDALDRFSLVVDEFLTDTMKVPDENSVILHGDCWCNNLLFKYEDTGKKKPSKVCLIDWQLSWLGSPVLDLSYFLFTCAPKEILTQHKKYLKIYHDSLSDTLRGLHCDPQTLFPLALLEKHWRTYSRYGLYMSLFIVKLMLSDGNEVPDMSQMADSGKDMLEGFSFETVHNNTYNRRMEDILNVSAENNWI